MDEELVGLEINLNENGHGFWKSTKPAQNAIKITKQLRKYIPILPVIEFLCQTSKELKMSGFGKIPSQFDHLGDLNHRLQ